MTTEDSVKDSFIAIRSLTEPRIVWLMTDNSRFLTLEGAFRFLSPPIKARFFIFAIMYYKVITLSQALE